MVIRKIAKYCGLVFLTLLLILILGGIGLYFSADMKQPKLNLKDYPSYELWVSDSLRVYGPNSLRLSKSGLWEMKVQGEPIERGVAAGKLAKDLLYYQETVFVNQIRKLIPSDNYLKFLRFCLILFNRNLGACVPEENREEIYGISLSCTDEYDAIGTPYERQLNYHAAHDIGHAMQSYMLVGCSSFAVWGTQSADSSLLIGRNFDFYVGDDFARNKLVSFYSPSRGYRFASVGWAGMTGVLSGMNETGLTVTINAAKSSVPTSAAMPISLLAREILQYASTIKEAYAIAKKRRTFVSESILIGSAKDGQAAIIEKSTSRIALYATATDRIVCTNHYQSDVFAEDPANLENIATSDSPYRFTRLNELLDRQLPVNVEKAAAILRDFKGINGKAIGLANEKAINQFIAHHSVIFQPEKRLLWVSTFPWQSGSYVAYDLRKVFSAGSVSGELSIDSLLIPADPFLNTVDYQQLQSYRKRTIEIKERIASHQPLEDRFLKEYIRTNPEMYYTWALVGDYYASSGQPEKAIPYWQKALSKEIPKLQERTALEKKIKKHKKRDEKTE